MNEIEVVIKIDKNTFKKYQESVDCEERAIIVHGTPLPKGRGRLIDEKILLRKLRSRNFGFNLPTWVKVAIDNTPTIIEADMAKSEGV